MRYIVFITFIVSLLASASAFASDRPIRVAVSPFVYLTDTSSLPAAESRDAVVEGMEDWVGGGSDAFELASVRQLRNRITQTPTYAPTLENAQLQQNIGVQSYRELDPAGAVTHLGIAREKYFQADHQFVNPEEVSEALLFYALALFDAKTGNPTAPLEVMKEMVLIDPNRRVVAGAFPDEVVGFYEGARSELERDVREGVPGETFPRRVASLSAALDGATVVAPTDFVLAGNVLAAPNGAVELVVGLYDVEKEQFQQPVSLIVTSPTPARLVDAAGRLASQLLSCLVVPSEPAAPPIPRSSGSSPFALQLNLAYASYYQFPSVGGQAVEPFDNLGAAIGGSFFLTREFALVAMFQFLSSTTEYSGLVQPGFTTLRSFAGGEIGVGLKRLRFALATLLEGTVVSNITTCPGAEAEDRRACNDAIEVPSRFLFGINARPRVSYQVLDSLHLFGGGSMSFYFLPPGANTLNFLTAVEAGLQYRF